MNIRPAEPRELALCVALNNRCILGESADTITGFLLSPLSIEELAAFSNDGVLRVAVLEGDVVGFILAFKRESKFFTNLLSLMANVEWVDPSIPSISKLMYVYKKAVEPSFRRRGIASCMYKALISEFSEFGLLGATVEKPVSNEPSRLFRERHQYRRVGTFHAAEFEGIQGYQSGIYFKSSV
jgi:ribosomal protein S18 acetylase RimI-like enzyme